MGCECAKPRYYKSACDTELQVSEFEDLLGLSKHNTSDIWSELKRTEDSSLSREELVTFMTRLNLNREGFDSPNRPLHNFYSFFRRNNAWDRRKLAFLGVLLGHGTSGSKVEVIYEVHEATDLKVSDLEKVFRDLLTISSIYLPSYAQYWMEIQSDQLKAGELVKYKERLAVAVPDTVHMLSSLLVVNSESTVGKEAFTARLKGDIAQALFNARQLRVLSLEVYKRGRIERERKRMMLGGEDNLLET